jgi:hypothetical protein
MKPQVSDRKLIRDMSISQLDDYLRELAFINHLSEIDRINFSIAKDEYQKQTKKDWKLIQ